MAGSDVRQAGNRDVRDGNQRLAVLGDAVSKAVLCQQWYRRKESLGQFMKSVKDVELL